MKVVILGAGRVGAILAKRLLKDKHEVAVIDWRVEAFRNLGKDFPGQTVLGTGIDEQVLKKAGIEKADAFIAVSNSDNTNLMSVQVVRSRFGIKTTIAWVVDPQRAQSFQEYGLEIVCPTTLVADVIQKRLKGK